MQRRGDRWARCGTRVGDELPAREDAGNSCKALKCLARVVHLHGSGQRRFAALFRAGIDRTPTRRGPVVEETGLPPAAYRFRPQHLRRAAATAHEKTLRPLGTSTDLGVNCPKTRIWQNRSADCHSTIIRPLDSYSMGRQRPNSKPPGRSRLSRFRKSVSRFPKKPATKQEARQAKRGRSHASLLSRPGGEAT